MGCLCGCRERFTVNLRQPGWSNGRSCRLELPQLGVQNRFHVGPDCRLLDEFAAPCRFLPSPDRGDEPRPRGEPLAKHLARQLLLSFALRRGKMRQLRLLFRGKVNFHKTRVGVSPSPVDSIHTFANGTESIWVQSRRFIRGIAHLQFSIEIRGMEILLLREYNRNHV